LLKLSLLSLLAPFAAAYYPQGSITVPANGTHIAPGETFNFTYNGRGDYCLSSFAYSVVLLTSPPDSLLTLTTTGHYFGRFNSATVAYAGVTPTGAPPAPPNLTMPDFSLSPGGFGSGKSVSNATFYLAVIEEYNECDPTLGNTLTLTANTIIYNATT
ncbi:hypothetical protein SISSUDRAFT_960182, partial [Sistotremastrum suecicum HHB10207 ss-3]